ncbi:MAG: insulinase family protein [Proteobacteria bacterium]|nr:insulinase family protein [Pseudomonadota bacterium]
MKLKRLLLTIAAALAFASPALAGDPQPQAAPQQDSKAQTNAQISARSDAQEIPMVQENIAIPFDQFTLENGLKVFLLQDNSLPIIAVNLWFDVGSKNEAPGRTGFAHLFEHLMFMGTDKVPNIDLLLESGGGSNNASTREDVTNYYTVAPENMLETVLFIEADRFAHLADAMTQEKLDKQRDVVLNERRESYENQPYGKVWLEMPALLYPDTHPYGHPVIGSVEDIQAATLENVIDFFNTYYVPANATLVVGGDFDKDKARALVEKYFGAIPKKPKPAEVAIPQLTTPVKQRLTVEDENVQLPRLTMLFHSPAIMEKGDAELDILSNILCKGQNSRLINRLIYEKQLASNLSCGQMSGRASVFIIDAIPLPGVPLDTLEAEILAILKELLTNGVTPDEFARTRNSIETSFVKQLQSIGSRADNFNSYYFYAHATDFPAGDLNRYRNATVEALTETIRTMFSDDARRAVITVIPKKDQENP